MGNVERSFFEHIRMIAAEKGITEEQGPKQPYF